jgi:hypothetical protein
MPRVVPLLVGFVAHFASGELRAESHERKLANGLRARRAARERFATIVAGAGEAR